MSTSLDLQCLPDLWAVTPALCIIKFSAPLPRCIGVHIPYIADLFIAWSIAEWNIDLEVTVVLNLVSTLLLIMLLIILLVSRSTIADG